MRQYDPVDYGRVFNSLSHFLALSHTVGTKAVLDNLIVSSIALECGANPIAIPALIDAINVYFSIKLSEEDIQKATSRLLQEHRLLVNHDHKYFLPPQLAAEVSQRTQDSHSLEARVKAEWLERIKSIAEKLIPKKAENVEEVWEVLKKYLSKSFYRHGVQTCQLFAPELNHTEEVSASLTKLLQDSVDESNITLPEQFVKDAVRDFLKNQTPDRVSYLAQLLDGTFSFFALNFDDAVSNYLAGSFGSLKVFLDTNFIFGILGLHNNPLVQISQELVCCISEYFRQFTLYYHASTIEEMQRTIQSMGERLATRKWSVSLSRAGLECGQLSGFEMRFHEKNVELNGSLDPKVFVNKYANPVPILREKGFVIFNDKHPAEVEEKGSLIAEYKEFVESRRKRKPYQAYDHDMVVLLATERHRSNNTNSVLEAGALFLTCDYHLYAFDRYRHSKHKLASVVLPNHLLQVLRPMIPRNSNFDQRFVATFAIPEFRTIGSDYSEAISKVLTYLATFKDLEEKTAARILADQVLIEKLKGVDENSEEFAESIENALAQHNEELLEEIALMREELKQSVEEKKATEQALELREQELQAKSSRLESKERESEENRHLVEENQRKIVELQGNLQAIEQQKSLEIQQEKERRLAETQKQTEELERFRRQKLLWRLLASGMFSTFLTGFFFYEKHIRDFIEGHPNELPLTIFAILIIWGAFVAIAFEKLRTWAFSTIVVAAIFSIISLL